MDVREYNAFRPRSCWERTTESHSLSFAMICSAVCGFLAILVPPPNSIIPDGLVSGGQVIDAARSIEITAELLAIGCSPLISASVLTP